MRDVAAIWLVLGVTMPGLLWTMRLPDYTS
jgi:hypothetical protein